MTYVRNLAAVLWEGAVELERRAAAQEITEEMVERGAAAIPLEVTPHGIHARVLARDVLTAALYWNQKSQEER